MLFSCLVDADFKDTEDYYNRVEGKTSDRDWSELPAILEGLTARLDAELARKAATGERGPSTVCVNGFSRMCAARRPKRPGSSR